MPSMASIPQPIGRSAQSSSPNGKSATASIPAGMMKNEVSGTASALAATP